MERLAQPGSRRTDSIPGAAAEVAAVAILYYLTAHLGLSLAFANRNVSAVWPPTGIAVAALVLRGPRMWPGIAIGAITANLANGAPVDVALGFSVGNTLAPALAAFLLRRFAFHPRLDRIIDVVRLAGFGFLSMLLSATFGTTILAVTGGLGSNSYWSVWSTWWVGDALGVLLFAPVLLVFGSTPLSRSRVAQRPLEAAVSLVVIAGAGYAILTSTLTIQYLVFPFVAWVAIRFRQLGATATIVLLSALSIWATVNGIGPHSGLSPTLRLVELDLFNGTLALSALLLAAVSEERSTAGRALYEAANNLEDEIALRTRELAESNAALQTEVAERAAAEHALRRQTLENESMLQAISDLGEGAVVVDMSTRRITYANDAYCRITGYTLPELQKFDSFLAVLTPEAQTSTEQTSRSINDTHGASGFGEAVVLTKDGHEIPVDWASARVRHGDVERSIGIVRDATERKRKLGLLEAARDAAQAASRAKGEYLSRMSHELRTPLTVIIGYSDLLTEGRLGDQERHHVEAILKAAEHLLALVNDVLGIARIEAGRERLHVEPVDAATVCVEAATLMSSLALKSGVALSCEVDGSACMVRADRQRLLQVLLNLISNGIKYGGRSVDVSATPVQNGRVRILVADTGRGLSEAEQMLLFQPFQRLEAAHSGVDGTGLGLALSKALVEGMGGTIGLSSSRRGTTFWVSLPASGTPSPEGASETNNDHNAHPSAATPAARTVTVLHIEDNPAMIEFVESLCRKRGNVRLHNAMLGRMGIDLAHATTPDLIILDLQLPDIDGAEILERLKADSATHDVPVVILSADAMPDRAEQLLGMGASRYLTKPVRAVEFYEILDALTRGAGAPS